MLAPKGHTPPQDNRPPEPHFPLAPFCVDDTKRFLLLPAPPPPSLTWPRLAAASDVELKLSKSSVIGAPSSFSMILIAFFPPNPGTLSCSCWSSSMYSVDNRSTRVDSSYKWV